MKKSRSIRSLVEHGRRAARSMGRRLRSERGTTFASQLVAVAIVGLAVTVFLTGLGTTSSGTLVVKQQVTAHNIARRELEAVKQAEYAPSYSAVTDSPVYSVTLSATEVMTGLQRVTVEVVSTKQGDQDVCSLEGYKRR